MTAALEKIGTRSPVPSAQQIGQATAVEQARAVAEVQAAVIVAQNVPRDMARAEADMKDTCGRLSMASRAFYSVPNRGTGPSVHLARELARIWGNVQYGVHELRRDDAAGVSEVQAFAWDVQTNTRSTRTFIAPHARMKGKERQALTDLNDIYLSNQNTGARAVRECIFTVLPTWFTEDAQNLCRQTLEHGEGEPLESRISKMIAAFDGIGINVAQLETRIGKKRGSWTAADLAQAGVDYTSIQRGEATADELFPQKRVTADEITKPPAGTRSGPAGDELITESQMRALQAALKEVGFTDRADKIAYLCGELGREINSTSQVTKDEASRLLDKLTTERNAQAGAR